MDFVVRHSSRGGKGGVRSVFHGYAGKILNVNLSTERLVSVDLDAKVARDFLGGLGFAIRTLYDKVGPEVDALAPANVVVIASGALAATGAPTAGRTHIMTK
ncbi:aldehyde ferredoxin oxidoreductase N-terminal domain-containing protein [Candidatus Bipolaricaulota bacterium]